ncbi:MAG: hypothetical protein CM15mP23_15870 [Cryomorphaceae bacterium]|nr:MAG: hypothetical protein CM15mP23_15870 [Cryomorphaceae bacterium]
MESYTNDFLDRLYSFEIGPVLFKPTKCEEIQFRPTKLDAKSYFIAGDDRACNEDKGVFHKLGQKSDLKIQI